MTLEEKLNNCLVVEINIEFGKGIICMKFPK